MGDLYRFPAKNDEAATVACAEVEEDQAAYVWGGLEAAERARIDRHREHCATCDRRLLDSERVISELDQAQPKIAPPADLRALVLEATVEPQRASVSSATGQAPQPSDASSARGRAPQARDTWAGGAVPADSVVGTIRRLGHRFSRQVRPVAGRTAARPRGSATFFAGLTTGLAGAAAAAALIVIFMLRPEALGLLAARQSQFGSSDQAAPPPSIALPWQAAAPTSRLIELRATSGQGRGLLAFDAQTRRGVLLVEGLSAAPAAEYAVWLTSGAQRVALGSLTIDAQGVGSFLLPDPLPLDRLERIEVTRSLPTPPAAEVVLSGTF